MKHCRQDINIGEQILLWVFLFVLLYRMVRSKMTYRVLYWILYKKIINPNNHQNKIISFKFYLSTYFLSLPLFSMFFLDPVSHPRSHSRRFGRIVCFLHLTYSHPSSKLVLCPLALISRR